MTQRKIKFRMPILNPDNSFKEWFYWGFDDDGQFISPHSKYRKCHSYEAIGLFDRGGNEIFEGDILQGHLQFEKSREYPLVLVQWNNEMGCFELKSINGQHGITPMNWYELFSSG